MLRVDMRVYIYIHTRNTSLHTCMLLLCGRSKVQSLLSVLWRQVFGRQASSDIADPTAP